MAILLFQLCRGGDTWPAARHLTFPCSISPVCGMAGTPPTCLQAWWEVLCALGMNVASQRNILGFYFDVRKFVLFYYLIESVSFCCFFQIIPLKRGLILDVKDGTITEAISLVHFQHVFPKHSWFIVVLSCTNLGQIQHTAKLDQAFWIFFMCIYSGLAVMLTWLRGTESEAGVPVLWDATFRMLCDHG